MKKIIDRISQLTPEQVKVLQGKWENSRAIPSKSHNTVVPLSLNQQRLYLHQQKYPEDSTYNMTFAVELIGSINVSRIEYAINSVVHRHEILRTCFIQKEGKPHQLIKHAFKIDFTYEDLRGTDITDRNLVAQNRISALKDTSFDLEVGPLLKSVLFKLEEERHILAIIMHHTISDAWSVQVFVNELISFYQEDKPHLQPLKRQYQDFSNYQRGFLESEEFNKQMNFWRNQLEGSTGFIDLPTDFSNSISDSFSGNTHSFIIDNQRLEHLKNLSTNNGNTLFVTIFSIFHLLLYQFTRQPRIAISVPVSGRNIYDFESLIGFFANTIVLDTNLNGDPNFRSIINRVTETYISTYSNSNIPFDILIDRLFPDLPQGKIPFSQVMFIYQNIKTANLTLDNIQIKNIPVKNSTSMSELSLECIEQDNFIECKFEYRDKLFKPKTIQRLTDHFLKLIDVVTNNPNIKLSQLSLPLEDENCMSQWNQTTEPYELDSPIHELFFDQALYKPEAIAFYQGSRCIDYRDLDRMSNQWARLLQKFGLAKGSKIGVCFERSIESMISIMSILKLGAIFVPLDINYPKERLAYMIEDSGLEVILTTTEYASSIPAIADKAIICVDEFQEEADQESDGPLTSKVSSDSPAYMIYTSGSTGKPKGVIGTHRNVVNRIKWMSQKFPFGKAEICCHKTSTNFIDSIWEMFGPLLNGVPSVIISDVTVRNINNFISVLKQNRVSRIVLVPSLLKFILDNNINLSKELPLLKFWVVSGEELTINLVKKFRQYTDLKTKLINLYGSSEVMADATYYDTDYLPKDAVKVPIGRPIGNTEVYILDSNMKQVPIGVIGEIYIGGEGVAKGYNRKDLTQERFVNNPLNPGHENILFKTGDLAKFCYDGNIEYIGRKDNQIKLYGVRIELIEIELALMKCKNISQATVLFDDQKEALCAYIVGSVEEREIKTFLSKQLPQSMIPHFYIFLEKLPLLPNGKIDRKKLLTLDTSKNNDNKSVPRTAIEEKLVGIWKEVLKQDSVATNVSFYEYGGNSIKASLLSINIYQSFGIQLPLKRILAGVSIQEIATWIDKQDTQMKLPTIKHATNLSNYRASPTQSRLFFMHKLMNRGLQYNLTNIIEFNGNLDLDKLENSISTLISRHEILRTSFQLTSSIVEQIIHQDVKWTMKIIEEEKIHLKDRIRKFTQEFDLTKPPLFRFLLVKHEKELHTLLIDIHHILVDGISIDILRTELLNIYKGDKLPPVSLQYKDYSVWKEKILDNKEISRDEEYWLNIFSDDVPVLHLPSDFSRPNIKNFEGNEFEFEINPQTLTSLRKLASELGVTLYSLFLSVFSVLLARISDQEDIVIGTAVSGRRHPDLSKMIGVFINNVAIRINPKFEKTYRTYLQEVRNTVYEALDHQEYPFEELVNKLSLDRDMSRNPLFDVMFIWHNYQSNESINLPELKVNYINSPTYGAKYDLSLNVWEDKESLICYLEYDTKLFKQETIGRLSKQFQLMLNVIEKNIDKPLYKLPLINDNLVSTLDEGTNMASINSEYITIIDRFDECARLMPNEPAVVFEGRTYSYKDLNKDVEKLANRLWDTGVEQEQIVSVILDRSYSTIVAILAILKSGGAFLTIDPTYPAERISYVLSESKSSRLISEVKYKNRLNFNGDIIFIDENHAEFPIRTQQKKLNPISLAYVLYTSGSTGKPKGVMIEHKALNNYISSISKGLALDNRAKFLALTTVSFDIFITEMLLPLCIGASVTICNEEQQRDMKKLSELINESKVNVIQVTPSRLQLMLENSGCKDIFNNIELLIVGGEEFPAQLLPKIRDKYSGSLFNAYGPTEATVWSMLKELKNEDKITIGRPLAGYKSYVLDRFLQLLPPGVPGELYIGGLGLSRGYLYNEDFTETKFIKDPYNSSEKIYRTGDTARLLDNGEIELIGRTDDQIKVRGYRIEPAEIESYMRQYHGVNQAVVVKKKIGTEDCLIGYFISEKEIDTTLIRQFLSTNLPAYMIPQYLVRLVKLPLTPNNKIDRKALSERKDDLKSNRLSVSVLLPENPVQKDVLKIWREILKIDDIGINDNFFDMGGSSILLMQMHERLNQEYPNGLNITELFGYPTIRNISEKLSIKTTKLNNIQVSMIPEIYSYNALSNRPNGKCTLKLDTHIVNDLRSISHNIDSSVEEILLATYLYTICEYSGTKETNVYYWFMSDHTMRLISINLEDEEIKGIYSYLNMINKLCSGSADENLFTFVYQQEGKLKSNEFVPIFSSSDYRVTLDGIRQLSKLPFYYNIKQENIYINIEYEGKFIRQKGVLEFLNIFSSVLETILESMSQNGGEVYE